MILTAFKSFKPSNNPEIVLNDLNVLNFLNVAIGVPPRRGL